MHIDTDQSSRNLSYRPDIDGLRALAVLAVLGFHAFPRWIPGGFVGVDVFFVISGFLITTIILTELQQEKFRIRTFYAKRIKRIFPALLLVLISSCLIGWSILIGIEYEDLGKHLLGGSSFASNFILMSEAGYFDREATLKPLLHLWSLGIEEQFYIVWPVLIVIFWKFRFPLFASLSLLILVSFGLNIAKLHTQPVFAFYHPFSRAWELASGGLLATLFLFHRQNLLATLEKISRKTSIEQKTIKEILSVFGIVFIFSGILFLDAKTPYPGWWATLPTLGAISIIAAGKNTWLNRNLLSHRNIVAIGLISYPLYLWHWPLLSFLHMLKQTGPSVGARLFIVSLNFVLAWLTYRFIEKPVRSANKFAFTNSLLCFGMVGVAIYSVLISYRLVAPRSSSYGFERFGRAAGEWNFPTKTPIGLTFFQGSFKPLDFQGATFYTQLIKNSPDQVLYMGDSQVQVAASRIEHLIATKSEEYNSAVFATLPGCPPIPNLKRTNPTFPACGDIASDALAYASKKEVKTVVIGGRWADYLSENYFYYEEKEVRYSLNTAIGVEKTDAELERMLLSLKKQNKRVYLMLENPVGQAINPATMVVRDFNIRQLKFDFKMSDSTGISRAALEEDYGKVEERLKNIARRTGAIVIDPKLSLCGVDVCPALTKSAEPMYRDAWHLRPSYMREHGTFMDQTLKRY